MIEVDRPLFQASVPSHPVAVNVAVSVSQIDVLSAVTVGADGVFPFLISISFDFGLTPQIVSQTTEYVPATLTVIVLLVAFVLHFKVPLQPVAVNVAVSVPQIVTLFAVIVGVVGVTPVRITTEFDDELVPQIFVQDAVYVPEAVTSNVLPVAPVTFHEIVPSLQPDAVNVAFSPSQQIVLSDVITGAEGLFPFWIVTLPLEILVPQSVVQVAVYAPLWFTIIVEPVEPLLQRILPAQPSAVNVAVCASQMIGEEVFTTGGFGLSPIVIITSFDLGLIPQIFSQVAEYVPAPTVIVVPVAFVLHFTVPLQPVAVNLTVSVPQTVNLAAVIVGVVGVTPVLISIELDAELAPQLLLQVAV